MEKKVNIQISGKQALSVLYSEKEIKKRLAVLAQQISFDYKEKDLVVLCILNGAMFFFTELVLKLNCSLKVDFIKISSYEGMKSSQNLKVHLTPQVNLRGKDVLIVEDIVDTGRTIKEILLILEKSRPKSIKLATLLKRQDSSYDIDYCAFSIQGEFVVGYGLDLDGNYRNLPYLATLNPSKETSLT
ncbi:MAG: hypoxanthine phosphoribosyltransferase [Zetaproteobacteria bacterium]|nr:hypoxanthine phosphoribosyltransferase [Pseudobdellovibrionaceae bacterium]